GRRQFGLPRDPGRILWLHHPDAPPAVGRSLGRGEAAPSAAAAPLGRWPALRWRPRAARARGLPLGSKPTRIAREPPARSPPRASGGIPRLLRRTSRRLSR